MSAASEDRPLACAPLIVNDPITREWRLHEEGLALLNSVTGSVAPVSIVGPARTGKSLVMNLLAGTQHLFPMGHTVDGCTRGIYVHVTDEVLDDGARVVLLDTEGLHDSANGPNQDVQLFIIVLLLSSVVLLNTDSVLREDRIRFLHCVGKITEKLHMNSMPKGGAAAGAEAEGDDGLDYEQMFPPLIWALRDFFLGLESGITTPDEYLEGVLRPRPGHSLTTRDANWTRECLRAFFPVRRCVLLPRPVENDADMHLIERMDWEDLRPDFRVAMDELRTLVRSLVAAKRIRRGAARAASECDDAGAEAEEADSFLATGPTLARYAHAILELLNRGAALSMPGLWEATMERALQQGASAFRGVFAGLLEQARGRMPFSYEDMHRFTTEECTIARRRALDELNRHTPLRCEPKTALVEKLIAESHQQVDAFMRDDLELSLSTAGDRVREATEWLADQVRAGAFGSMEEFEGAWGERVRGLQADAARLGRGLPRVLEEAARTVGGLSNELALRLHLSDAEREAAQRRQEADAAQAEYAQKVAATAEKQAKLRAKLRATIANLESIRAEGNRRAHEAEGRLRELQESHEREMKEAVERGDRMRASMERVMKERLEKSMEAARAEAEANHRKLHLRLEQQQKELEQERERHRQLMQQLTSGRKKRRGFMGFITDVVVPVASVLLRL